MKIALEKIIFLILFMFSSALFSQEYAVFDTDRNGVVDYTEFKEVFRKNFSDWDGNRDGVITEREFYDSSFDLIDTTAEGVLNPDEWEAGFSFVFGDFLGTPHNSQFDLNGDREISKEEFFTSITFSDFFRFYDENGDGVVDLNEFNTGVFAHWDEDQNQYIEQKEYETFGPYFMMSPSEEE